jgi:phosphate uptake regulator
VQNIRRKRVTRVGSGAYSIYLPKKWIDAWSPEQRKQREVDLHFINRSLLVVPVIRDRTHTAKCPNDVAQLRARLLAAYVRGHQEVRLTPAGRAFDSDCIAAARDFLRHLDERLSPEVRPDSIGYRLQAELPPSFASGDPLLQMMVAKVGDLVGLAAECIESGNQPDRLLHAARLLVAVHDEDVSRMYHQALRLVATLELPLQTVSDFQILDLVAAELHDIGRQAVAVAHVALGGLGLSTAELGYPRQELLRRIGKPPAPPAIARDILRSFRPALQAARELLQRLARGLQDAQPETLMSVAADAAAAHAQLQEGLFRAVVEHWGEEGGRDAPAQALVAYRLSGPVANVLDGIGRAADRAVALAEWKEREPA